MLHDYLMTYLFRETLHDTLDKNRHWLMTTFGLVFPRGRKTLVALFLWHRLIPPLLHNVYLKLSSKRRLRPRQQPPVQRLRRPRPRPQQRTTSLYHHHWLPTLEHPLQLHPIYHYAHSPTT